ncbi:MAG: hypothetical protein HY347_05965 [candidate division NC10 bacterium]|nr:hypothetical protein [candidate division NC10 bacterium]
MQRDRAKRSGQARALASFLEALERRLGEMSGEELREVLLGHAERLPPEEREGFLAIFAGVAAARPRQGGKARKPRRDEALIGDVERFVEDIRSGTYYEGWGWDQELHEERAFGDESWAGEMDALFERAHEAFLEGDLALAREAYSRLLKAFHLNEDTGTFCGPEPPQEMVETDVSEAKARYLRSVYETTPQAERVDRLLEEMEDLCYVGGHVGLRGVMEARRPPLPDLEAFLPPWVGRLRGYEGNRYTFRVGVRKLLAEAVELQRGTEGLADLARTDGRLHPEAYLDWVEALIREGEMAEAIAAAREALREMPPEGTTRAQVAERLAHLALEGGDGDLCLEARREAFRALPTTTSLLALCEAAAVDRTEEVIAAEADRVQALIPMPEGDLPHLSSGFGENYRLVCLLLLLAGRGETAIELLRRAPSLGWSSPGHPGPLMLPYLLVAATGRRHRRRVRRVPGPGSGSGEGGRLPPHYPGAVSPPLRLPTGAGRCHPEVAPPSAAPGQTVGPIKGDAPSSLRKRSGISRLRRAPRLSSAEASVECQLSVNWM